jgi:RNA polymerase sigma-70 factor (ECF subfamily)
MAHLESEHELVIAALAGNAEAMERLLSQNMSAIESYIKPKIPDNARRHLSPEDLVNEVLAQAYRDIDQFTFHGDASFLSWLKTIANHRLMDALKGIRRKKRGGEYHQLCDVQGSDSAGIAGLLEMIAKDSHLPERSAARREAEQAIQVALAGLPDDQRHAIRSNVLQGKSIEEIAQEMGRTENAVRGLIHRGKKNLAEAMGRSSLWFSKR